MTNNFTPKMFGKLMRKDRGFTLVEIIVVLVILAILAAFTIPTMLGFVNDAKAKAMIAEVREVYVAAQATATEYSVPIGEAGELSSQAAVNKNSPEGIQMAKYLGTDIKPVAGIINATDVLAYWDVEMTTTGKINKVNYTKNGKTLRLDAITGTVTVN